jgi:hypothetical protein
MRKAVMPFVLSMGLIAVWAAPADAASTRAEYVAQVDPLCRANLGPWQQTYAAEVKGLQKWVRLTKKGTLKAWVRQTHKYARALERHAAVHASLTEQISAVQPPAEDAQLVADWLMYRNEYERLTELAVKALDAFKFKQWEKNSRRANGEIAVKEQDAASSLGLREACK